MQPYELTVQALAQRVTKLEAQNRRFRKAGMAAIVVALAVAVMGQARTSRVLEANEFVLKDNSGTVRASLSVDMATGPILTFYRDKIHITASLTGGDEPTLFLSRARGEGTSILQNSGIRMWSKTGSFRVDLGEQGPSLDLLDDDGYSTILGRTDLVGLGSGRKERTRAASLVLFGKDRKVLWSAPIAR